MKRLLPTVLLLVFVAGVGSFACKSKAPTGSETANNSPTVEKTPTKTPASDAAKAAPPTCTGDADCVLSCIMPDECCTECHCTNIYHRDQLADIRLRQSAACDKRGQPCPQEDCGDVAWTMEIKCVEGRCTGTKRY